MNETRRLSFSTIDWRWLVITYCFLVLFHLLPSLFIADDQFFISRGIWRFTLWAAGGMALVSAYVGRRSRGITILEPGIASMLYMGTLIFTVSDIRYISASGYRLVGLLVAFHLIAFLVGCFGAAAGEWLQARRERRQEASENS